MNTFRSKLLSGKSLTEPLLRSKTPREEGGAEGSGLDQVDVPRSEARRADHRGGDRHRLPAEAAVACWKGEDYPVELINLSGGGAMIAGELRPKLWDRVDLTLGECGTLETAVRWIRQDRIGLEFAHETCIEGDDRTRNSILRAVLARSFPDVAIEIAQQEPATPIAEAVKAEVEDRPDDQVQRRDSRHPLIWMGLVHFNHESTVVRLRNISISGALVESSGAFPVGAELLLDLDEAGSHFGTVHWAHGDQAGLRFQTPFDVSLLARSRPQIAPARWSKPDYLRDEKSDSSPWAAEWGRLSLRDLYRKLDR